MDKKNNSWTWSLGGSKKTLRWWILPQPTEAIVVKCFKFIQFKLWMKIANSKPLFEYLSSTYVRDIELSILCYLNKT